MSILLIGIIGNVSQAQPPGRPGTMPNLPPAYSPYLNLTRGGGTAAQNYYGLVRPELDFRSAVLGLQNQITQTQLGISQQVDPQTGFPVTGHTAVFLNTGGYFMNLSGGPGGTAPFRGMSQFGTQAGQFGAQAGRNLGGAASSQGLPAPRR